MADLVIFAAREQEFLFRSRPRPTKFYLWKVAPMTIEQEWQELRETIRAHIAKHGRCIQVVGGTESDAPGTEPFMYTIGNYALGFPELLIVGTDKAAFGSVLNRLSQMQIDRKRAFDHEELVSIGGAFPFRIIDTGERGYKEYAYFARHYYKSDTVEVRQVLLPDTKGRWPDTPDCDAPYREQPILSAIKRAKN
jgi:hypothetical protein